ncbi:MAG: hypothetical protein E6K60_01410 [Nitrospirae bacterium]|nr:MAG: hypothetical protein E6K60_01410 [Nitrospirota bacterium]
MRPSMFRLPLLAWSVAFTLSGCGGTTSDVVTDPSIDQYRILRVAVLPFSVGPLSRGQERGYAAPVPSPAAGDKLADLFYVKLNAREGLAVTPPERAREAMAAVPSTPLTRAETRTIGAKLEVDAVLTGTVEVYKERAGSRIGLERPQDAAEVGFVAKLISVKEGIPLWTGQYYERQRPANEDLTGFLERGPRYLTVDELASSAVDHVLRQFPFGTPMPRNEGGSSTP